MNDSEILSHNQPPRNLEVPIIIQSPNRNELAIREDIPISRVVLLHVEVDLGERLPIFSPFPLLATA